MTVVSDLYAADIPWRSEINIKIRPKGYNILHVTEIGGDTADGIKVTNVSIITTPGNITTATESPQVTI